MHRHSLRGAALVHRKRSRRADVARQSAAVERVIEAATRLGARIAEPGEFTERAVLNGKLDLVQAESIADLINARTTLQAKLSLANLEGVLSGRASAIRETLLSLISRLEAALDF